MVGKLKKVHYPSMFRRVILMFRGVILMFRGVILMFRRVICCSGGLYAKQIQ